MNRAPGPGRSTVSPMTLCPTKTDRRPRWFREEVTLQPAGRSGSLWIVGLLADDFGAVGADAGAILQDQFASSVGT